MTPEDHETLEQMYAYAASRAEWHPSLMAVTDSGWDEDDLAECVEHFAHWGLRALAIRAALVERTCGTCRHCEVILMPAGATHGLCHNSAAPAFGNGVDLDDGCLKGWAPKEGA